MTLSRKSKKRSINKESARREKKASKDIGGSRVVGSGCGIAKGDARNEKWMVEDKFTKNKSYSVTQQLIEKVLDQAGRTGRKPVIRIGLPKYDLAVVLWDDLKELISEELLENTRLEEE